MSRLPSPADLEVAFHAALTAGDAKGVEAALMLMAPQDPQRAQMLLDLLHVAVVVAQASEEPITEEGTSAQ
jgi:hypothetical protein